jgi:hypothetical protein
MGAIWEQVYHRPGAGGATDVDEDLYGGFISNDDKRKLESLRAGSPSGWPRRAVVRRRAPGRAVVPLPRAQLPAHPERGRMAHWEQHRAARLFDGNGGARTIEQLFGEVKSKVLDNSPAGYRELGTWLAKQHIVLGEVHVCMESTGIYSEPVALGLQELGLKVSLVNPACIKGFAQSANIRNKNDKLDAAVIARYCVALCPALWQAPPLEQRQLRAWNDRLGALKDIRQQELNRIEAHEFAGHAELVNHVREHIHWLDEQIERLEKDIDNHIDRH